MGTGDVLVEKVLTLWGENRATGFPVVTFHSTATPPWFAVASHPPSGLSSASSGALGWAISRTGSLPNGRQTSTDRPVLTTRSSSGPANTRPVTGVSRP